MWFSFRSTAEQEIAYEAIFLMFFQETRRKLQNGFPVLHLSEPSSKPTRSQGSVSSKPPPTKPGRHTYHSFCLAPCWGVMTTIVPSSKAPSMRISCVGSSEEDPHWRCTVWGDHHHHLHLHLLHHHHLNHHHHHHHHHHPLHHHPSTTITPPPPSPLHHHHKLHQLH